MSKFFCNGADSECNCPILCADCTAADWTGGTEIKTNADRIRAMSDEEIADWVSENGAIKTPCDIICGGDCKAFQTFEKTSIERCKEIVMKWLQQTAGEEDKNEAD